MSTPIFDQLAAEYAAVGNPYAKLVKPIPTGLPKRIRPYASATQPVAVPMSILEAAKTNVPSTIRDAGDVDTVMLPVVKPLSVRNLA